MNELVVNLTKIELDAVDRSIVAILQQEGRISNLELAERIGLSPTPCSRRVKRLETNGIITGYTARVDPGALGHGISVMVNVRLSRQSPSDIEDFVSAVKNMPEITECLLVAGSLDYVLRVRTRDVEELKNFVLAKLKNIPSVSETTTLLILETAKSTE